MQIFIHWTPLRFEDNAKAHFIINSSPFAACLICSGNTCSRIRNNVLIWISKQQRIHIQTKIRHDILLNWSRGVRVLLIRAYNLSDMFFFGLESYRIWQICIQLHKTAYTWICKKLDMEIQYVWISTICSQIEYRECLSCDCFLGTNLQWLTIWNHT